MSKSILIIEQDEPLADELIRSFKDNGYVCNLFHQEAEGFKKIKELQPDILVLDDTCKTTLAVETTAIGIAGLPTVFVSPAGDFKKTVRRALDEIKEKLTLASVPADLANKKILWVEDDTFIGDILSKKFSAYNCRISLFTNGDGALKYLDTEKPDIIILDLLLPGMSGFDILKKIRDNHTLDKVPVVVLSNSDQPADINKARAMGIQKFLVKAAVSLDDIIKVVAELLR
jgi:DNA-binding response OmpR family regulator